MFPSIGKLPPGRSTFMVAPDEDCFRARQLAQNAGAIFHVEFPLRFSSRIQEITDHGHHIGLMPLDSRRQKLIEPPAAVEIGHGEDFFLTATGIAISSAWGSPPGRLFPPIEQVCSAQAPNRLLPVARGATGLDGGPVPAKTLCA